MSRWEAHEELAAELEGQDPDPISLAERFGVEAEEALAVHTALAALRAATALDEPDDTPDLAGERIGDYEVVERLGVGGFGIVYRARDPVLAVDVAIKLVSVPPGGREEVIERFQQEARTVAKLDHENIVRVRSAGVDRGGSECPYLVLDLVPGESLQALLDRDGVQPLTRSVEIVRDLALALEYAHEQGVLHRDVKPDNVLLTPDGQPKLTDFGLAKDARAEGISAVSQEGHYLGTPGYWPPEQAHGDLQAIGPASDVYGLGATLYALLTGRAPFTGPTILTILNAMASGVVRAPSELRPEADPGLEAIVLRCLESQPKDRYQSPSELADVLTRWLADPVSVAPRRKRGLMPALGLGVVGVGIATALALGSDTHQDSPAESSDQTTETPSADPPPIVSSPPPSPPPTPPTWTRIDAAGPSSRAGALLVYDPTHRRSLLFGGVAGRKIALADLWSWDGQRWTRIESGAVRPPGRWAAAGAYDTRRDTLVVISGRRKKKRWLPDMWEWNGQRWIERALPDEERLSRKEVLATWDPRRQVVVAILGRQVWEWNGVVWSKGARPPVPALGLTWDSAGSRLLLLGQRHHQVWAYVDETWRLVADELPARPRGAGLTGTDAGLVLFGGKGRKPALLNADTWLLHDGVWRALKTPASPGPRTAAALTWDSHRRRVVLFGGQARRRLPFSDTWELSDPTPRKKP